MALTTTVAGASSDSYISVADASTYFDKRLDNEVWKESPKKEAALFTAMRVLDALPFIGERQTETQALAWPRVGIRPMERAPRNRRMRTGLETLNAADGGIYDLDGKFWVATAVPTPIKYAQCELALAMLVDPSLNDAMLRRAVLKTGRMEIDHHSPAARACEMAHEFLANFLLKGVRLHKA